MPSADDPLFVVTANYSHVLNFAGYPRRVNPILGKVREDGDGPALDALGLPYPTLSYANGPGYRDASADHPRVQPAAGRPALAHIAPTDPDYRPEALGPLGAETTGAADLGISARSPGGPALPAPTLQDPPA